jgi:hypothetical protein
MTTPVLVNASTSIVQIDSSQIVSGSPAIVWLSTLNAPGTVITVRDSYGDCSLTKQIVVSTTKDVHYLDGVNVSSYTINQPYGYLTVTPKTSTIWGLVNTYAFPDASRAAILNTLNANQVTVSTLTNNLAYISSLTVSSFTADSVNLNSSIVTLQSTITNAMYVSKDGFLGQNLYVGSTLTAGSSIQTRVAKITSTLEVPKLDVQFSTGISLNVAGQLVAIGAISTLSSIYAGDLISTTSNLGVGGNTFLFGQLRGRGLTTFESNVSTLGSLGIGREALFYSTLITRDIAYFNSHVSTASNLLVAGGISTLSNLHVGCNANLGGDLRIIGNLSTHGRVDVGGTMSIAGNLAVGGDIFFADRLVDLDNLSVTQTLYVGNTISTLSSIAAGTSLQVQGSTLLLGHVSAFSTMSVRGNVSTQGSLAVGGSVSILSTLVAGGSISTLSNLNVAGVISTPSSIIAGDILQVRNAIYGFSSLVLASSLQVGGSMSIANFAYVQGGMSTVGSVNFFSSLQVQGSMSVMSSVAVSCNLTVNGILTAGSFNLPGSGNLLTLGVTSNAGFVATVSSSTLHMGLFSSMGGMNLAGFFSTTNAIVTGSTMNANFVTATRGMSTLSNLGVGNDLQVASNLTVGGQLSNLGAATFQSNTTFNGGATTTATFNTVPTFNQNVLMTQQLTVQNLGLFENTLRVYGAIDCWNGLNTKAGPNNTFSNLTNLSSMTVEGLATFSNITNARFLAASTLMASTVTAPIALFSSCVVSTLTASNLNIQQGATRQTFTSSIVASSLALNHAAPRAIVDILGGADSGGASGSNMMAMQFNAGGFRHYVTTRHNSQLSSIGNAINFFPNNSLNAEDSSTAGRSNVLAVSMTPVGVGIYTSTPSFSLDVQGSLGARNIGGTNYGHVKLFPQGTNAENCITFYSTPTVDNTWPWMVGLLNGVSPTFVITPISNLNYNASMTTHFSRQGNVGLGVASPSYKLDVNGIVRTSNWYLGNSIGNFNANTLSQLLMVDGTGVSTGIYLTKGANNNFAGMALFTTSNQIPVSTLILDGNTGFAGFNCNTPRYPVDINGVFNASTINTLTMNPNTSNLYVAIGYNAAGSIVFSSDAINWSSGTHVFNLSGANGMTYGNGIWVALGQRDTTNQVTIQVSTNGRNFSAITSGGFGSANGGMSANWNGQYWVAVGADSTATNTIQWSTDARNWSPATSGGFNTQGNYVAWNGTYWVAVGLHGSTAAARIQYSTNGKNWVNSSSGAFSSQGNCVAWNGQMWVAVGQDSAVLGTIKYSYDGLNWSNVLAGGFSSGGFGVAWNGKLWVAVGNDSTTGRCMQYSTDGINWSYSVSGSFTTGIEVRKVIWSGTLWLATAFQTNPSARYSLDGSNWLTTNLSGGTNIFYDGVAFSSNTVPSFNQRSLIINAEQTPNFNLSTNQIDCVATTMILNETLSIRKDNNRVGININEPTYSFDVNGVSYFRENILVDASNFIQFNNSLGRKISLWAQASNSYYGFEIQSGELRTSLDTTNTRATWGWTNSSAAFTEWMALNNGNLYVKSGASNRLILGPNPSLTNLDYCSLIQSCNFSSGNFGSELSFWTHGTSATNADPTRAMTIDSSQRAFMFADNGWAARGGNPMVANLTLQDNTQRLKLGAYRTTGQGAGSAIQAADFFNGVDNGNSLFLNPLGGNVAIGTSNAPTNRLEVNGNTSITGNLTVTGVITGGGGFVQGMIITWFGTSNTIPTGWRICDGTSYTVTSPTAGTFATPDLREKFIIGSGRSTGGFTQNATGGASTITLTATNLPAHSHTITDPGHNHNYTFLFGSASPTGSGGVTCRDITFTNTTASNTTGITGTTTTMRDGSGTTVTGNPAGITIIPQYRALIYIMYVGT